MNTHTITPEQLDKLVEAIDKEFNDYLSSNKASIQSFRECFYIPDMYEEQGLYALKDEALDDFPDEVRQKAHNMIAEFSSVD